MAPLVISMVPMLQSTSKKSGNASRNRRSGSITHGVMSSSVYTTVFAVALVVFTVVIQKVCL